MNLHERANVTDQTRAWFAERPFSWRKSATCVHMVRRHLSFMGHRVPPVPRFQSERSAIAALNSRGWDDLAAMLGSFLPPIAPAERIVGDIVQLPSDGPLGALCIEVGNGRIMGYSAEFGVLTIAEPLAFAGAWRA